MNRYLRYVLAILWLGFGAPASAQQADQPVSKTYRIQFKTVQEFVPMVQAILSNRGQIQSSDALNMIVVRDRPAFLMQVDSLITSYDRPAQQLMFRIYLLLGSNDITAPGSPDSTSLHELLDPYYDFTKYEELDKVYIRTEEKQPASVTVAAGQFAIALQAEYIPGAPAPVRIRQFTLSERVRDISGQFLRPVYSTAGEIQEDMQEILAAIKHEGTGKTLIVLLSASRL